MTFGEDGLVYRPASDRVMKWIWDEEAKGAVAMTSEAAFQGLCLGFLIRGDT